MSDPLGKDDLDSLIQPPPKDFDKDYAAFLLAVRESRRKKPWLDRAGVIIALVASLSGAAVSLFNAVLYWNDRTERARKENFDDQVAVSRIYFEKMAGTDFCPKRKDAMLYARVSLSVAGLKEDDVISAIRTQTVSPTAKATQVDPVKGVERLAYIIYKDLYQRDLEECRAGDVTISDKPGPKGKPLNVQASDSSTTTGYGLSQIATNANVLPQGTYSVYIQYVASSPTKERALRLQKILQADPSYRAPGIQGVRSVPQHDQIRIYRLKDADQALALQKKLGLGDAQIVNLESAFKDLPPQIMEVWLHQ